MGCVSVPLVELAGGGSVINGATPSSLLGSDCCAICLNFMSFVFTDEQVMVFVSDVTEMERTLVLKEQLFLPPVFCVLLPASWPILMKLLILHPTTTVLSGKKFRNLTRRVRIVAPIP